MKYSRKIVTGAIAFGLIAGTVFQGTEYIGTKFPKTQTEDSGDTNQAQLSATNVVSDNGGAGNTDVSDIVDAVLPSLVSIDVKATVMTNGFFGPQQESSGSGSGILIAEKDGKLYIATNNHVVEGADSVTIRFCDDTAAEAQVKGLDGANDLPADIEVFILTVLTKYPYLL